MATNRETDLFETLSPFVQLAARKDSLSVVEEWISQALHKMLKGKGSKSFTPYNGYFQTPRELRPSFSRMVEMEFEDIELGQIDAVRILARSVREALNQTLHTEARPMLDECRIAPRVFELLELLFDLDPNEAYRWAARAVRDRNGFAKLRSANGAPAVMTLYYTSPAVHLATGERSDIFVRAVFDWCAENAHEGGAASICLTLLPRVLEILSLDNPSQAVARQVEALKRLSEGVTSNGETLPEMLDELAWRNAALAASETVDSSIGIKTEDNFRKAAEELKSTFSHGLHHGLEAIGLGQFNCLVSATAPNRTVIDPELYNIPIQSFGDGGMLEAVIANTYIDREVVRDDC